MKESGALQVILEQGAECLIKLGEWKQTKQWIQDSETKRPPVAPSSDGITGLDLTKVYAESLEAFESGQFSKSHEIISNHLRASFWNSAPIDWSNSYARLQLSEVLLLDTMSTWRMLEDFAVLNKSLLLSEMKSKLNAAGRLLEAPLGLVGSDGPRMSYPFLIQSHCVRLVELRTSL